MYAYMYGIRGVGCCVSFDKLGRELGTKFCSPHSCACSLLGSLFASKRVQRVCPAFSEPLPWHPCLCAETRLLLALVVVAVVLCTAGAWQWRAGVHCASVCVD